MISMKVEGLSALNRFKEGSAAAPRAGEGFRVSSNVLAS